MAENKQVPRLRQVGGWGCKTERSGGPHRESKPSAQRQRTARTTRQINGAIFVCG
ncbi:MAG: hypothetical protein VXW26_00050 [SAR324 cluster bacterium]|nr:hypothetical protein [SAR324 cluster bacterium]